MQKAIAESRHDFDLIQKKFTIKYYKDEVEKCNEELQTLKREMRNLENDKLEMKKMTQNMLESKLEYYRAALIMESIYGDALKEKKQIGTSESYENETPNKSEQGMISELIERYYEKMIDNIMAHKY